MAGEGSGSGGNRRFLTAVRRLIIKAQRKGKDDSAGKEELDPSAVLADEIRRGPRGRRSQQLEAGMASPVSQNSSPNTGRRKEAATKLGLGRSWGSLDALAPPSTPEHRRYRYPVECNQCMLVQTGEKAHYLGLPCDACGQLPRSASLKYKIQNTKYNYKCLWTASKVTKSSVSIYCEGKASEIFELRVSN